MILEFFWSAFSSRIALTLFYTYIIPRVIPVLLSLRLVSRRVDWYDIVKIKQTESEFAYDLVKTRLSESEG